VVKLAGLPLSLLKSFPRAQISELVSKLNQLKTYKPFKLSEHSDPNVASSQAKNFANYFFKTIVKNKFFKVLNFLL